jgi:hypothetical protein
MKKRNKAKSSRVSKAGRSFRVLLAAALLTAGVVTAIARRESTSGAAAKSAAATEAGKNLVTVEVAGNKLQVDARTLQQGPLRQDQAQALADTLKGNQSTQGLVEIQHADGSTSLDLQGRFQDVMMAQRNDDGTVSHACVNTPEAAREFLQKQNTQTAPSGTGAARKAPVKVQ